MKQSRGPFAELLQLARRPAEPARQREPRSRCGGSRSSGVLLILGLFTRLASLGGIGFILLFYLGNPPFVGYFYSLPTEGSYLIVNKNLVELCALVVILVTGSGRFAGLDRILHASLRPAAAARERVTRGGTCCARCGPFPKRSLRVRKLIAAKPDVVLGGLAS